MKLKINSLRSKFALSLGVLLSVSTACTDQLQDLNVDKKALTGEDLQRDAAIGGFQLPGMQNSIININPEWQYQLQQSLNADVYSGYMMTPTPFAGNVNNLTYSLMDGWNGFIVSIPFNNVMNPWLEMKNRKIDEQYPDLYAIGLVLKVFSMHRVTDVFGPLPYTRYGQGNNVPFDSQQEIYKTFFAELKQAVDALTKAEQADASADQFRFSRFDRSEFGGDYKLWVKAANTLRLRLAIRIAKVDPVMARQEAEAAVSHPFGVLESSDPSFRIKHTFNHPLATISNSWNDILLGAPMESILGGYNDPRLPKFAKPATDAAAKGDYKGIRQGIDLPSKDKYVNFSRLNFNSSDPVQIMNAAESYFLRAEGTLRGWNMGAGTAEAFYENGIRASFTQYALGSVDNYLQSMTKPKPYVDPKNATNNVAEGNPNLSTITVNWNEAAPMEEKLERIITQKWIATFPEGQEAWSEFRRTGYPKLFPVVINNSQGKIPTGGFIKRLTYPATLKSTSPTALQEAVTNFLGGNDSPNTPLWWDVD